MAAAEAHLEARHRAEQAARQSYGRLLAQLAARTGDIAAAEDALAEAFEAALRTWPERGIPASPEAWLWTAARRNAGHRRRHTAVQTNAVPHIVDQHDERNSMRHTDPDELGDWSQVDARLKLLFVCAHPAIDPGIRTPLMLQTVLGLDAVRIGSAFLVAPATMGQRLVRAKAKIKLAGLRFEIPAARELPERLHDVLQAVYSAYGTGWDDPVGSVGAGFTEEAIFLGRLLVSLLPDEPETWGLLSVMLHCEARRDARRDPNGRFVPLHAQNPQTWNFAAVMEAEQALRHAATMGRFGQFQCEAAIQSVHAQRAMTGETNSEALLFLYNHLLQLAPTVGVAVSRAAAILDAGDPEAAAHALDTLDEDNIATYQPWWVTRARVAEAVGDVDRARQLLQRAIGLTEDPAVRTYLTERLNSL
jgi:RNA polymerase sigma-70 factor (ECF subfamily)